MRSKFLVLLALVVLCLCSGAFSGCTSELGNAKLTKNTYLELVDWHISGLWIINCPVAWIRVTNYNAVPIKNIIFQYNTYDSDGRPLNQGTHTIEESVEPGKMGSFIELYLGLVDLESDKLSVKLLSVNPA